MAKKEKKVEKPEEDLRIQQNKPKFKDALTALVTKPTKPKK